MTDPQTSPEPGADAAQPPRRGVRRRGLLVGSGLAVAGLGAGVVGTHGAEALRDARTEPALVPFHGDHQAGVATPIQAHGVFAAFDLHRETDREAARRLLVLLSDDAERLMRAEPAIADQEPELATTPARLTVTVGFGPGWFTALGLEERTPTGFADLPAFDIDRLQDRWSGGDLLLQVAADDPTVLSHAVRHLSKTARSFATPRWMQRGFTTAMTTPDSPTPRNLFGQVDGTVNPRSGNDFADVVWSAEPGWFAGGTTVVLRRIAMNLDTWDELDVVDKELSIGRRLSDGSPLTGTREEDPVNLTATDSSGLPVIPRFAHAARAHARREDERFLRRSFNYDDGLRDGHADVGLVFAAYQADLTRQFLPVQQRLAAEDMLNTWTVPIGSAVFVIPPGCRPGGFLGEGLLR